MTHQTHHHIDPHAGTDQRGPEGVAKGGAAAVALAACGSGACRLRVGSCGDAATDMATGFVRVRRGLMWPRVWPEVLSVALLGAVSGLAIARVVCT